MDRDKIVRDFYQNYYDLVFSNGSSFSNWAYKQTHLSMERSLQGKHFERVLEIGAGNGEHFKFIRHTFESYLMVDQKEPSGQWDNGRGVEFLVSDVLSCDFEPESFDRIIMTCVLHHVSDPWLVLKRINSWLKVDGVFTLFLPSDPGMLNRLVRAIFVTPKSRNLGFTHYELFNAFEHKNHYWGLEKQLRSAFLNCTIKTHYYPINIPLGNLSLFSVWNIEKN